MLISQGKTRVEASLSVGRADNTIDRWVARYPEFKIRYEHAKAKARGDFVPKMVPFDAEFREKYLGFSTPPHMQEMIDGINEVAELARERREPSAILILAPPGHAKSTIMEDFVSWRIATDPNVRCLLVSKTLTTAKKRSGRIQRRLTDRSRHAPFIDTYGPFKPEGRLDARPWNTEYFTVVGQDSGERDHTLRAVGIGGQIYGDRAEVIVLDDIADLENQLSPTTVEKQMDWVQIEASSRLVEDGVLICIGTHMAEGDIYTKLEELGFFDKVIKMPAITELEDGSERALWPEKYPLTRLHNIRDKRTPRIWSLVFQQNPLPEVGSVFTMEAIEGCFDTTRYIGHIPPKCRIIAGVDPSVSKHTAGVVIAVAPSGMRYLVDAWNEEGLTGEGGDLQAGVVEFILELCRTYRVTDLAVENYSWSRWVNTSFTLRKGLQELGVRHHAVSDSGAGSGDRENIAMSQLSGLFSHGLINIPAGLNSLAHLREFFEQLVTFRPDAPKRAKNDLVKAFKWAEYLIKYLEVSKAPKGPADPYSSPFMRRMGNG